MKKILICFAVLILTAGTASAQRGLNSYPVFRGKVVPKDQMVTTEVRGWSMATYKLDYYRGVHFKTDMPTAIKVAELVGADAKAAVSCETERVGDILTYALIQPKPAGRINRYLCYQAQRNGSSWSITILYLEGVATLDDLKNMFGKQENKER